MALPGEVQIGRFSRFFSKLTGSKGPSGRFTFGTEIQPQIELWSGVENRFLDSWQRFGMVANQPAVASNLAEVVLRNPPGSAVVAVLEKVLVANAVAGTVYEVSTGNATAGVDLTTVYTPQILDRRWAGSGLGSTLKMTSGSTLGGQIVGTTIQIFIAGANVSIDLILEPNQQIVLLPGDGFQVRTDTVNQAITVSLIWRQRALEESEQQ